jgi:hypothetical protein
MCPPHICFFLVRSFDVETSKQHAALLSAISAFLETSKRAILLPTNLIKAIRIIEQS